jgi:outer membrane protein assembly factor BamA
VVVAFAAWLGGAAAAAQPVSPPQAPVPAPGAVITEVRVHGNHETPDEEVLRLTGVAPGDSFTAGTADAVAERLRASGRFDAVEVRVRFTSITASDAVALVIIVSEKPRFDDAVPLLRPVQKVFGQVQFLPVLDYTDGYGFTYGLRTSFIDLLGEAGRVSVPLTWGATRRAAVEAEKAFARGPFHLVAGSAGIWQRENPFYDLDERRVEVTARASRALGDWWRAGVRGSWAEVEFDARDDAVLTGGAELTLDTRLEPAFPRNAVWVHGAWDVIAVRDDDAVHRWSADARGFLGLPGTAVLALRGRYDDASAPLPPYEKLLLGGASTLRGFPAGAFAGDGWAIASAELRIPLTSPLRVVRFGVDVFGDAGTVWDHGDGFDSDRLEHGVGAGLFFLAPLIRLQVDVAYSSTGRWRAHLDTGIAF